MVTVLAVVLIATLVSIALIGLMNTDLTHASLQHAVARSFYLAQAGLQDAKVKITAAADPAVFTTPAAGVTVTYGSGHFMYWVDAGPADHGCAPGLKTLEAHGSVGFLGRTIGSRVRACGVPGTPVLVALFGVGRVEFRGSASRVYLAPSQVGSPGGGGNLGSFTEVNFANEDVQFNALSEDHTETVALRDGTRVDYALYGFALRPDYNPNPLADTVPWVLAVFGDLIKGRPSTGSMPNRCATSYACLTVGSMLTDVRTVAELRGAKYVRHVYLDDIRKQTFPVLALAPRMFQALAAQNTANAELNRVVGLGRKADPQYERMEFYRLLVYLAEHQEKFLRGAVYVRGTVELLRSVNLGGDAGDVTLAIEGDLIVNKDVAFTNRHDLSSDAGRRRPGIVVLGAPKALSNPTEMCGHERVTGSGRLVMCEESSLTVDELIYTQDGMAIQPKASVDQVGAMYHGNRGTSNPSFTSADCPRCPHRLRPFHRCGLTRNASWT